MHALRSICYFTCSDRENFSYSSFCESGKLATYKKIKKLAGNPDSVIQILRKKNIINEYFPLLSEEYFNRIVKDSLVFINSLSQTEYNRIVYIKDIASEPTPINKKNKSLREECLCLSTVIMRNLSRQWIYQWI